ncbi:PREDICTED: protein FAM32A-like [Ceratosolen solmsi marchali]|uniref:Protein FAM32A-like n=1 Tax=Ceratosolen solmsi marchali TaxID=326594 RepID=A0AAJ6VLJ8_9HYME|nr:PREDICTED: protein FAM32A-like [Ceratosolen solmsi marchali]
MPPSNEEDPYQHVAKGTLKIKGTDTSSKKKKKKNKEMKKLVEVAKIIEEEMPESVTVKRTKAELAFQKMKEKTQNERIKQKASKTHKQRVEEFNRHLDGLTEHFDIPKVSWTK